MWQFRITEPRRLRFAFMKQCCNFPHGNRKKAADFCRLQLPGVSIKCYSCGACASCGLGRAEVPHIASVSVCNACVPLDRITSFATRTVKVRYYCLVKVRSSDGAEGLGYCYAGNSAGNIVRSAVQELLAPMLIGEDSTRVEGLWEEMYREALLQGRTGSVMRALSALDIALWDLNARSAEMPLFAYLGCWTRERVPAYASGGYYLDGKTPQHLGEELASYVQP